MKTLKSALLAVLVAGIGGMSLAAGESQGCEAPIRPAARQNPTLEVVLGAAAYRLGDYLTDGEADILRKSWTASFSKNLGLDVAKALKNYWEVFRSEWAWAMLQSDSLSVDKSGMLKVDKPAIVYSGRHDLAHIASVARMMTAASGNKVVLEGPSRDELVAKWDDKNYHLKSIEGKYLVFERTNGGTLVDLYAGRSGEGRSLQRIDFDRDQILHVFIDNADKLPPKPPLFVMNGVSVGGVANVLFQARWEAADVRLRLSVRIDDTNELAHAVTGFKGVFAPALAFQPADLGKLSPADRFKLDFMREIASNASIAAQKGCLVVDLLLKEKLIREGVKMYAAAASEAQNSRIESPANPEMAARQEQYVADSGNPVAMRSRTAYALAQYYKERKDSSKYISFFEKAVELQPSALAIQLGHHYMAGDHGLKIDYEKARKYYQMGIDGGNAWASAKMATIYEKGGHGLARDLSLAVNYSQAAARGGCPMGMFDLGRYYEKGVGVDVDVKKAIQCYRACMRTKGQDFGYRKRAEKRLKELESAK